MLREHAGHASGFDQGIKAHFKEWKMILLRDRPTSMLPLLGDCGMIYQNHSCQVGAWCVWVLFTMI